MVPAFSPSKTDKEGTQMDWEAREARQRAQMEHGLKVLRSYEEETTVGQLKALGSMVIQAMAAVDPEAGPWPAEFLIDATHTHLQIQVQAALAKVDETGNADTFGEEMQGAMFDAIVLGLAYLRKATDDIGNEISPDGTLQRILEEQAPR